MHSSKTRAPVWCMGLLSRTLGIHDSRAIRVWTNVVESKDPPDSVHVSGILCYQDGAPLAAGIGQQDIEGERPPHAGQFQTLAFS